MPESQHLEQLLARLSAGDPSAAHEVVEQYSDHLRRVIRHYLARYARGPDDSLTLLADVWASFFVRELYLNINDPNSLVEFLCGIARHKALEASRAAGRPGRDARRQVMVPVGDGAPLDGDPGPFVAVAEADAWGCVLADLSDLDRRVLELLHLGHKQEEVASHLGVSDRTVRRAVENARQVAHRLGLVEQSTSRE